MTSISSFLTTHDIFKHLSREEVDAISEVAYEKHFQEGEIIYRRRSPTSHFFLVLEGTAVLHLPAKEGIREGMDLSIATVEKGELFGISPVLGFDRYTLRALAETSVTLLAIEVKPFLEILRANPTAQVNVVTTVARSYYSRYLTILRTLQGMVGQLSSLR